MLLLHQNTGKENRYGKDLSAHWGDLIEQIKYIHFKVRPKSVNSLTVLDTFILQSWKVLPLRYVSSISHIFETFVNVKLNILVSLIL